MEILLLIVLMTIFILFCSAAFEDDKTKPEGRTVEQWAEYAGIYGEQAKSSVANTLVCYRNQNKAQRKIGPNGQIYWTINISEEEAAIRMRKNALKHKQQGLTDITID